MHSDEANKFHFIPNAWLKVQIILFGCGAIPRGAWIKQMSYLIGQPRDVVVRAAHVVLLTAILIGTYFSVSVSGNMEH